jgi:hypothetical protein
MKNLITLDFILQYIYHMLSLCVSQLNTYALLLGYFLKVYVVCNDCSQVIEGFASQI